MGGGGFRKEYFLGYDEIVDIFFGSSQLDFFFGGGGGMGSLVLYIYFLGLFLKVKVQNWRMLYVKYFWGMPDVPDIFLGVNSR